MDQHAEGRLVPNDRANRTVNDIKVRDGLNGKWEALEGIVTDDE